MLDQLVRYQGFIDRADQYERVKKLSDGIVCQRSIVRHKLSGIEYEMRSIDTNKAEKQTLAVFNDERQALQMI